MLLSLVICGEVWPTLVLTAEEYEGLAGGAGPVPVVLLLGVGRCRVCVTRGEEEEGEGGLAPSFSCLRFVTQEYGSSLSSSLSELNLCLFVRVCV